MNTVGLRNPLQIKQKTHQNEIIRKHKTNEPGTFEIITIKQNASQSEVRMCRKIVRCRIRKLEIVITMLIR